MGYFDAGGELPADKQARLRREKKERNWRAMVENTGRRNKKAIKDLRHSDADQRRLIRESGGKKAAKPAPKPKGDQQIDPPKQQQSTELTGAQKIVNDYQNSLKDQKSPWAQAQNDVNSSGNFGNFNPGGKGSSTPDAQNFADKYKLDLISSGATKQNNTDFTAGNESSMSSADILKRDKQMYG